MEEGRKEKEEKMEGEWTENGDRHRDKEEKEEEEEGGRVRGGEGRAENAREKTQENTINGGSRPIGTLIKQK